MAANCARRALLSSSSSSAKATLLNTSSRSSSSSSSSSSFVSSGASKLGGLFSSAKPKPTTTSARLPGIRNPFSSSRLPVELGCAQSLMPLHTVTASALLTSMLSFKAGNWAWLSEGFATPL